ncbi:ABC transporter substrate-binding protein [Nocardia sp. CDC160]|uniref:ABC transporter substrate-binding protein n=1 Tax=Nocardia sp. CDC160 TaxID=3112166 RepID=UPI002DB9B88F|nr:ABC transporter substrate-binding protein [Nocardia sp. CDC160]MEC3913360.1 ABC transporter substrate-binding protein [Nocardia sp. CDC160]
MKSAFSVSGPARGGRSRILRVAVAAVVGVLAIGLSACGAKSDDTSAGGGEPVTITHALGQTTVTGTPKRVVALGNQWLDTSQALGVTPVGYIDNIAVLSKGAPPWEPAALSTSKALQTTGNLAEQVAALNPDLILADPFIADAKTYGDLSKVAPTLPALGKETITPWADQVRALGQVLHKSETAEKLISDLNGRIDTIAQHNPGLKGKTFTSSWLAGPSQLMVLTDPNDGSSRLFTQLGMTIPPALVAQGGNGGRLALSPERLDELTADLLLAGYSPGMDEKYRTLPGFTDLPAVKKNATVFLTVQEISAINQPTPLSLPYLLDKLTPAFANAAK